MRLVTLLSSGRTAGLAVVLAAALTVPAMAQTAPEQAVMDLWCGIAFTALSSTGPAEPTDADKAIIEALSAGGAELIEKSHVAHLDAGFTEDQFLTAKTTLEPTVMSQIEGTEEGADYTSDECSALISLPEGM